MPGIHPNDCEKKLKAMWASQGAFANALRKITVFHPTGFRGFTKCEVDFCYPLTVICGKNGVGKSTLLGLTALAYHALKGFTPRGVKRPYYTFNNFFYRGPLDADYTGVTIQWEYRQRAPLKIKKKSKKWMNYEKRPQKAVQYIGTARVTSAMERQVLKSHFKNTVSISGVGLTLEYLQYLSCILERNYTDAKEIQDAAYKIRTCHQKGKYSSFNMGAGEDVLIELLGTLQSMPNNSLCIIEEIELGLHPSALKNLARVLLEICKAKQIQFVISTHSRDFLDAVPREARILLTRSGSELKALPGPTTRFVMGEMGADRETEMSVYCEDDLAAGIIASALNSSIRSRIDIIPIGSKNAFPAMAEMHFASQARKKCLFYWDGDVKESEIQKNINKIPDAVRKQMQRFVLPGNVAPECYLLAVLLENPTGLAEQLNVEDVGRMHEILEMAQTGQNHHSIPYIIAKEVAESEDNVKNAMIRAAKKLRPDDFRVISENISSILDAIQQS